VTDDELEVLEAEVMEDDEEVPPRRLPVPARRAGLPARRREPTAPATKSTFQQYIEEVTRIPLLTREEEQELAQTFQQSGDPAAARRLVEANLRFVVKMAYSYGHYNVKLIDLIQEGNIGLMKAVEKFNPERGYRLISYAVWWIKAYMQNYIIRSWSMVKLGTTQMQRQLFFRSQSDKQGLEQDFVEETLSDEGVSGADGAVFVPVESRRQKAGQELGRAARDFSLDATIDSESQTTFLDALPSGDIQQEDDLAHREMMEQVAVRLNSFIADLPEKEAYILQRRLLTDEPETLAEIGDRFQVSRERIRQIENSLKDRLRKALKDIEGVADLV